MRCWFSWIVFAAITAIANPTSPGNVRYVEEQDGITYNVFHHGPTDSKLRYVNDSGICETTPGVHQHFGHNPETAPLILYLNGGPGASDAALSFSETGPCMFRGKDREPSLNMRSFDDYANLLYVDQPIATGYSYGDNLVHSSEDAAEYLWRFVQAFLADFKTFQGREFGILGVSYSGHTVPALGSLILQKNDAVHNRDREETVIDLKFLGLGNAWINAAIQGRKNIEFACRNPYRPLIDDAFASKLLHRFDYETKPQIDLCQETRDAETCLAASNGLSRDINQQVWISGREKYTPWFKGNLYRIDKPVWPDPVLQLHEVAYLQNGTIMKQIHANQQWREVGGGEELLASGDYVISFMPQIEQVLAKGISVLIVTGDADYMCSWAGSEAVANQLAWTGQKEFREASFTPYLAHGREKGSYKRVENLTLVRVFDSGHSVGKDQPKTAFQIFEQTLKGSLKST